MKIKYRVWDTVNNRPLDNETFSINGAGDIWPAVDSDTFEIDPWTNRRDKHRVDIYLNDIVRLYNWNEGITEQEVNEDRVIGFREGCFIVEELNQDDPGYCGIDMIDLSLTEVIKRKNNV